MGGGRSSGARLLAVAGVPRAGPGRSLHRLSRGGEWIPAAHSRSSSQLTSPSLFASLGHTPPWPDSHPAPGSQSPHPRRWRPRVHLPLREGTRMQLWRHLLQEVFLIAPHSRIAGASVLWVPHSQGSMLSQSRQLRNVKDRKNWQSR